VGVAAFALAPDTGSAWLPVASTFVLGIGLGLLSVCTVVGPQSTVTWNQRGVVTGTIMFCRYLGQSLGAAVFGAVFNAVLLHRLRTAPAALRGRLPHQVNGISGALGRSGQLGQAAAGYLRDAISEGTRDIYFGLAAVAAVTAVAVLVIIPRRFATNPSDNMAAGHDAE
jgi:sugar phosphate permease